MYLLLKELLYDSKPRLCYTCVYFCFNDFSCKQAALNMYKTLHKSHILC